jgi:hypothetical protein
MNVTVDRLASYAKLYGCDGIFPAAVEMIDGSEPTGLAAFLPQAWRPSTAEQARTDSARASSPDWRRTVPTPISETDGTSGCSSLSPRHEGTLSVAEAGLDLTGGRTRNGA